MFDFEGVKHRYHTDAVFKQMVDMMYMHLKQLGWTPQELREAAYMASVEHANRTIEPRFLEEIWRDAKRNQSKECE
jgi:predicted RNA binding protein YcfA (HicA-like mRNA interferase family)